MFGQAKIATIFLGLLTFFGAIGPSAVATPLPDADSGPSSEQLVEAREIEASQRLEKREYYFLLWLDRILWIPSRIIF